MKQERIKLIDLSRCTACRGCQVACKQWNELPAKPTKNTGSYQNPPDLQWNTWTLIRFQEHVGQNGALKWLFRKDGCMHCTDAGCVKVCPTGALTIGTKDAMLKKAYKRAKELGGEANVYGDKFVDGTHVVYVLPEKVEVYDDLPESPKTPLSIIVWKDVLKPAGLLAAGGVVAGAFLHYITHGPKTPDEETTCEGGKEL